MRKKCKLNAATRCSAIPNEKSPYKIRSPPLRTNARCLHRITARRMYIMQALCKHVYLYIFIRVWMGENDAFPWQLTPPIKFLSFSLRLSPSRFYLYLASLFLSSSSPSPTFRCGRKLFIVNTRGPTFSDRETNFLFFCFFLFTATNSLTKGIHPSSCHLLSTTVLSFSQ